jgi:PAS domain S-box-containing protein
VRDITSRKLAEKALAASEDRFRSLVESTSDWIWEVDKNGRYTYSSPQLSSLLGYEPEEVLDKTPFDLMPHEEVERVAKIFSALVAKHDPINSLENTNIRKDGQTVVLETKGVPFFDDTGAFMGYRGIDRDITERKQAEVEIHRLNAELEAKVEERTEQLLEAQEELVRKEKLSILGQLSGSVGHELRNPLGVMNNAVYFLKMIHGNSDEKTKEYLDIIKHEIVNSQRIITDLLDFARTKTPQTGAISVIELLNRSIGNCVIPDSVNLQTEIPDSLPLLKVDPLQLEQVFQNLITNAVQAMQGSGELRISANSTLDDDFIEISISDTGDGISPENMKKLFQPLFTTKSKGIGLGLVVCRNLVEANGGRIWVESEAGKGTVFNVILPH